MSQRILHMYDFLFSRGGAESVSLQLSENFQQMDLLTGFVNYDIFSKDELPKDLVTLGEVIKNPVLQAIFLSRTFENLQFSEQKYDKYLYSGSYATIAASNQPRDENLYYCHTPPRFLYDLNQYYLGSMPFWQRPLFAQLARYVQPKYERAVANMSLIIANSGNVKKRIKRYLGRESVVVYPPCDTKLYSWLEEGGYYLSTARLEPYKRVDKVVSAFLKMPDKNLVVASGGSQLKELKRMANDAPNIKFTGWNSQAELIKLVGASIATIYVPIDEDFGMSPVESMAAGKPVIGVAQGGLLETVSHENTGLLVVPDFTERDICDAVTQLTRAKAIQLRSECEEKARSFSKNVFFEKMTEIITG